MPDSTQTCPRRLLEFGPWERTEGLDSWTAGHSLAGGAAAGPACSFCGSLHPDRFMELLKAGWFLGPTDKTYKAYIGEHQAIQNAKFYYLHLSSEQCDEFVALYNAGQMNIGYPGHLYVPPFFARPRAEPA